MRHNYYCYTAKRDIISECIGLFFTVIGYQILDLILLLTEDSTSHAAQLSCKFVKIVYIVLFAIIHICMIIGIQISKKQKLEIGSREVIYRYGWLTRNTKTIAANKIRSCEKSATILQRICGTMNIYITTAGDQREIGFHNI